MPKASKTSKSKSKKEDKAKKDAGKEKEVKIDKHPGYACLYLGDKELNGYGFKTGDGLLDVAAFKTLKKNDILEEIQFKGKMCAFAPFRECIENYDKEELLFVWDADEQKEAECNFYFCTTTQTLEAEKQRLGITDDAMSGLSAEELQRIQLEKEEQERQKQFELERVMEEERIANAIAELRKPLVVRTWTDLGSLAEIEASKIKWSRAPHKLCISKKRKHFGDSVRFSDHENVNSMNVEIKSAQGGASISKSAGCDVYRMLVDRNVQIGEARTEQATQTQWNRKVNKIVQYEYNEASIRRDGDTDAETGMQTQTQTETPMASIDNFYGLGFDTCDDNHNDRDADEDQKNASPNAALDDGAIELDEQLEQFLDDVYGEVYEVLTNNAMVNIFEDDFAAFVYDEHGFELDTKTENMKEIQTFVDLYWSRGKKISDIHWMPTSTATGELNASDTSVAPADDNIVAVSCVENMSFEERVNIMNRSRVSAILLWNLSHILLKAQVILTAPTDIFTFKFHPTNRNIIIGGLETGQVALWDLNDYYTQQQQQQQKQAAAATSTAATTADDDDDDDNDGGGDTNATSPIKQRLKPSTAADFGDDEDDEKVVQIAPKMLSYIEKSHTKRVTDLLWLPSNIAVSPAAAAANNNGALQYIELANRPKMAKLYDEEQFMSVAGDGSILFWDIQTPKQSEKEKKKNEGAKWVPIYKMCVDKKGLQQNLFTDRDAMEAAKYDPQNNADAEDDDDDDDDEEDDTKGDNELETILVNKLCYTPLSGRVVICTELGEYALYNFGKLDATFVQQQLQQQQAQQSSIVDMSVPSTQSVLKKHSSHDGDGNGNGNADKNDNDSDGVHDNSGGTKDDMEAFQLQLQHSLLRPSRLQKQHFLDVKSVCVSPHFCDIYLTFGDWRFCIWRNSQLLFTSPCSDSYICCGCWSPTRPAVILTAKYDGSIDVWDLLDQTYSPVIKSSPVSSVAITSITFAPSAKFVKNGVQQLAVGDCNGNLRILQIPRNLAIPLTNENVLMAQFYQKEYVRIQFINRRYKLNKRNTLEMEKRQKEQRELERERREQQQLQDGGGGNGIHSGARDENELQRQQEQEINAKLETKYEKMLIAFKKQLKIEQ
eukprot:CAMPEP_0202699586 /NCGR_PEP_ID=MMETSP1385-20130828/12809_1 /ASSEMBLY_ACC=CAM_ASM_000861 /TAXON_ID=933848 /ORGANISM="Elphidium margaritaceum" /LENGTH=1114 /DNA_ID=CAMNT_0049356565 /DNA_START=30 /DNA_END=3374 /DNA_ORIENTATION=+